MPHPSQTPISLYIHIPWCIRKCPYCDFNSHKQPDELPEKIYIYALIADLHTQLELIQNRPIQSIFIGGGTPSLFQAESYSYLFNVLKRHLQFQDDIEITLEANPGTFEQRRFEAYRHAGINRLSVGVQSFCDSKLKTLGRVHNADAAKQALSHAKAIGFNFNIDIMHGLPEQTLAQAMDDLHTAIEFASDHLSWYQLTIEPNTVFYKKTPALPDENVLWDIETSGKALLADAGFIQYEVSAYAKSNRQSKHNLNYWQFGDYLGIGAGAHSKLTSSNGVITRYWRARQPKDYLNPDKAFIADSCQVNDASKAFEFMLNALRLYRPIHFKEFEFATGLPIDSITPQIKLARQKELLHVENDSLIVSELGRRFLNDLVNCMQVEAS